MKEEYNNIKKDFDLPDFDLLNNEFEIITIEPDGFLLREKEKLGVYKVYSKIITGLFPESTPKHLSG